MAPGEEQQVFVLYCVTSSLPHTTHLGLSMHRRKKEHKYMKDYKDL